jgi:hypothetical protein
VLNLSGSSQLNLYGSLTNAGTVNWMGGGTLQIGSTGYAGDYTGWIVNQAGAVFNVQNDQTMVNGSYFSAAYSYFNNAGLFRKSPTTGTTTIALAFTNTGTVDVESGTVAMQSQYTGTGGVLSFALNGTNSYGRMSFANSLALASAGSLQAHIGNGYSPNPGDGFPLLGYPSATGNFTSFNLPQQVQWQPIVDPTNFIIVAITSQQITNSYTWTGAVSLDWFNANNWSPIGVPNGQAGQAITFSNGTINLSAPITINGVFNWLGGALTGNPLTIATNGALSIGGNNVKYLQAALTNAGTATWWGGNIVLGNCTSTAGSIVNSSGALWAIWCDQTLSSSCANANSYWENMGSVVKSYGAGTTSVSVPFYNTGGTIEVGQGTFALDAPALFNGAWAAGNGAITFNLKNAPTRPRTSCGGLLPRENLAL